MDKDLDLEGLLPDYCPDISRLIRVDCTPFIESSDISGERCLVNGRVVCSLLYETDYKNKIKYASFSKDFSQSFDVQSQGCIGPVAFAKARCTHISCKMLSPRKFIIKPRLQLNLDVYGNATVKTMDTRSGDNIYYRTTDISYDKKLTPYTEDFVFEEEIPLLQGEKSMGEIIFGKVTLQPPQVTMSGNDALIKTNAVIKVLYEEDGGEGELIMSTKILPLNMTLNNLEIDETGKINVSLCVAEERVTSELDAYGENRIIKVSFTARAKADMSEKVRDVVATDLFSTDYVNKIESAAITLPTQATEFDRTLTIEKVVTPERPFVCPLFDTDITINELRAEQSEGGVTLSGNYTVSVLGRTADVFESFDFSGEFNEFIPVELPDNTVAVDAELFPFDYSTTMIGDGSLSLRIILNAKIRALTENQQTIISAAAEQEPVNREKDAYAVIYYFPAPKDDLWSIAKKYYVNPEAIKSSNPNAFDERELVKSGVKMVLIKK